MDIATGASEENWIVEGSDQTFMEDVIQASQDQIVLVDFWAPWCGPCRQMMPTIEKVVKQSSGDVKLVKINIDENQGVAGQMGVRSVPTVVAFKGGQPVNAFQGAQTESKIQEFIKSLGGGDALAQIEAALEAATEAFQGGDINSAQGIYAQILQALPDNIDAIAGLARCYLAKSEYDRVREVLEMVPADKTSDPLIKSVITALELVEDAPTEDENAELIAKINANPDDLEARFELAKALSANGKNSDAADQLLTILEKELEWKEGAAKEQLLKIFEAEGPASDISKKGRRRLSSILFS